MNKIDLLAWELEEAEKFLKQSNYEYKCTETAAPNKKFDVSGKKYVIGQKFLDDDSIELIVCLKMERRCV